MSYKIIELQAENIKKIKAIQIRPSGNLVKIEGQNANGKTSVMDSIAMALGGKKLIPENPIRNGESTAQIRVDLGDLVVTRKWTKSGATTLTMENKEGMKASSPQEKLDKLIGKLSFDPMEFCTKSKDERVNILKSVAGVDLSDLEKKYKELFDERALTNRMLKNAEGEVNSLQKVPRVELGSIDEVMTQLKETEEYNRAIVMAGNELSKIDDYLSECMLEIEELEGKLKNARSKLHKIQNDRVIAADKAKKPVKDTIELVEKVNNYTALKSQNDRAEAYEKAAAKVSKLSAESQAFTAKLDAIKKEKEDRIQNAKMPIDGLDFKNGDVSFEGIEFSQISSAQQIRVSMAMAMALNPEVRIVRILNGSLLDSKAMQEIEKMAYENDFQVWIERVADARSAGAIYIEEGEVKEETEEMGF